MCCVQAPLLSLHVLIAAYPCSLSRSRWPSQIGSLFLFHSSLWFPFVSFKAGRRMPSIFMRFWYTSFHLLQYLLYQEIGGERMADQPDIASLAFQRQPLPLPSRTPTPCSFFSFCFILLSTTRSHLNLSKHSTVFWLVFWKRNRSAFVAVVWCVLMLTSVEPLVGSGPIHTSASQRITFLRFTFPTNLMGV